MTNEEIIQRGILIRDETEPAQNTSERVGGVIEGIGRNLADKDAAIAAEAARNGYYQCTVSGTTLAVTAPGFTLPAHGGNIRIKMSAPGTGASTLNINSTGAKALLYNGAAVSAQNTWEAGEIISVFYDPSGSGQYLASNSQGGGGKAEKIKYNNSQSGLAAENVQEALDEIQESVGISPLCYDDSADSDLDIGDMNGNILAMFANGDVIVKKFHSGNIGRFPQFSESNPYVIGDYCTYNHLFYKFTSAHLGEWDETDVERVTVLDLTDKQIYTVDFNDYDLGFEDEYGNVLVKFAGGHIYTKYFNSETAAQGRPYPPLNLYRLNKKTYEDIVTSWTEGADYVTSTDTGVSGGLKLNRQYAMVNRQLVYDFSLASGSSACFGTKVGIASGQYMGTDDFIRIGTDGNIQTFTYNQYSSATATKDIGTATITADTRYRLIIDKCGEWNKDKTKITILTFNLLETVFETELLQSANNNLSFYDYPFCFCESGTVKLYDLCVKVSNVCHNRKLAIFGDSITEGWMAGVDGWAHLVARHIGKAFCQVSGRDTSRIDDVIARVRAECASNPPQYIMVTVGTNSGNTLAKLQSLIDLILSYNSIPILNHVSSPASANTLIDQAIASYPNTFIGCCKMDEAVALGDSYSGTDGTHPNTTGHNLMYQQVIKDMPELFD